MLLKKKLFERNLGMQITEAEWKILELLWGEPMTITQLTKALFDETRWKKNTIITMLNRMVDKGVISYKTGAKARVYYAVVTKEELGGIQAKGLLSRFFSGNRSLMISALVQKERLKESEIEELCKLLGIERVKK